MLPTLAFTAAFLLEAYAIVRMERWALARLRAGERSRRVKATFAADAAAIGLSLLCCVPLLTSASDEPPLWVALWSTPALLPGVLAGIGLVRKVPLARLS